VSYKYVKQGYEASFKIVSYYGMVMEYYADAGKTNPPRTTSYFNRKTWLKYVAEIIPDLPTQFKLTINDSSYLLKPYYSLLGVNTSDEYGWICEYSTVGMAPARRMAVIEILREHRIDLLKNLVEYPNLQTRLYAVDALIYNDYTIKMKIQKLEMGMRQKQTQLERLQKRNADEVKIKSLERQIKNSKDSIAFFTTELLTMKEWEKIYALRDSNQIIRTCGNAGSYKIYETTVSDLLSDKAIALIPKQYEGLKRLGYLR